MFRKHLLILICFTAFQYAYPQEFGIDSLHWITGCWTNKDTTMMITEQWMKPSGNIMLGMSRTVSGSETVSYEFLRIVQDKNGGVYYIARPSGKDETQFRLIYLKDREAVFENPVHDFPQRIIYKETGEGKLLARIEGKFGSKEESYDYPMFKTGCEN